ncbi:MAG: hypothetical protein RIC55_35770 [Pirellulaceae bacterium]
MPRISRLFRALLAESLAIGLLVVLFGLPTGDVASSPPASAREATQTAPVPTIAEGKPGDVFWRPYSSSPEKPIELPTTEPTGVRGQLDQAASWTHAALAREFDRILAPFIAARSTDVSSRQ